MRGRAASSASRLRPPAGCQGKETNWRRRIDGAAELEGRVSSTRSLAVKRPGTRPLERYSLRADGLVLDARNGHVQQFRTQDGGTVLYIPCSSLPRASRSTEDDEAPVEGKSADDGACFEIAAASTDEPDDEQTDGEAKRPVRLKVLTKLENLTEADESMESNSLPPNAAYPPAQAPPAGHHFAPGQQFAYAPDGGAYRVEMVPAGSYETHSNAQPYYYTSYVTETPSDPRYVVEQPPAYFNNGYGPPPPSSTAGYAMHAGGYANYPPHGMPAYDQRSQLPPQRAFHDPNAPNGAAGRNLPPPSHPGSSRPLGPPPVHQPLSSTITQEAAEGKKLTKKRSSASTHSVTSLPIDAPLKPEAPKKQFQCLECSKCVSSLRNLTRHQTSCKARKEKKSGESSGSGSPQKSFESTNSPPKRQKQAPQPKAEPQSAPPVHHSQPTYHVYVPEGAPPGQPVYHPPPAHQYAPQYAPPHTALPQAGNQTMFEYPPHNQVQGMSSGLHSAPPTVNFPPSGPSFAQGQRFEPQRPMEYAEDPYAYGNSMPVDPFINASIDEMANNPLAFIGSPAAQSSSGPSYEASGAGNADGRPTSFAALQPVPMRTPAAAPPSAERPKNAGKPSSSSTAKSEAPASDEAKPKRKKGERKNSQPTPYRCEACQRYMCSSRSLRRHRSTCKQYLQTAQLTTEDKLLIAKQEENKCEMCGKILQSPSNLRRHRAACKQKSEEETRIAAGSPTSRDSADSATADSDSNSQKRLQPPPEAQTTPSHPPSAPPAHAMPPPSLNSSGPLSAPPTTVLYVKQEETFPGPSVYVDSRLTVGEHLRQHIGPNQQAAKRGAPKRPVILGRKASLQNPEHEAATNAPPTAFHNPLASPPPDFHAHSAPPVVEPPHFANGSEEAEDGEEKPAAGGGGVNETVDQVVEKIRRQSAEQQGASHKRFSASGPHEGMPPAKMLRAEKPKPLAIITTQPLQPVWRAGAPPRPPASAGLVVQQQPPPQRPPQTMPPAQPAAAAVAPVTIARYVCMECLKYYACRKNLRAHRMNAHALTEEAVDAEGPPPRLKVRLDGEIMTAGYEQENQRIRKARASGTLIPPTVAKNNTKANGGAVKRNSAPSSVPPSVEAKQEPPLTDLQQTTLPPPHSAPPMPPQHHYYHMDPQTSVDPSLPHYESLQPMRMEFGGPQYSNGGPPHSASHFGMSNDLDYWDQIRPTIDKSFDSTASAGNEEIDRIVADLKRSAEANQISPHAVEPDSTTDDGPPISTTTTATEST